MIELFDCLGATVEAACGWQLKNDELHGLLMNVSATAGGVTA
ncbi:hypothetical protein [Paraburkholderia kirstenboschensis]|uniref:Uncharacterized protein n=1 Tax=Paraburkholderia kirstenboschensis TaxID=1245436 RepID=A0ABZ0E8K0_9BURK|nr:hypothetical protein [Paraburkholderia kirstenboschensis]WOD13586.1 hypothetical protein RW095_06215 [Paraburkholderia kirstenboschensis]